MLSSILRTARVAAHPAFPTRGFARLTLIGRLGADPEVKQSKDGKEYIRYTVATSVRSAPAADGSRSPPETNWHTILSFNPASYEYLTRLRKGAHVFVEAAYEVKNLEGNEEFAAKKVTNLRHEKIKLLDKGPSQDA